MLQIISTGTGQVIGPSFRAATQFIDYNALFEVLPIVLHQRCQIVKKKHFIVVTVELEQGLG